jgi:hypothetical protein
MATQTLIVGTPAQQFIESLYLQLLHRDVDAFGLANFSAELNSGQGVAAVIAAITSSREYYRTLVDDMYVRFLNRHADEGGMDTWVGQLQAGKDADDIRASILASQEFANDSGGTDQGFVTALYQLYLYRTPEQGGLEHWEGILNGNLSERQEVALAIATSDEGLGNAIDGFYLKFLHRHGEANGLNNWKAILKHGESQQLLIDAFLSSAEYLNNNGNG